MIIAPSLLAADFLNLEKEIDLISKTKAEWLHLDVMDGNFVPNITFGYDLIASIQKKTNMFLDVHLMIADPLFYIDKFIETKCNLITVHYESCSEEILHEIIAKIKKANILVGISIKPNTDVHVLDPFLRLIDLVLIMSVEPGFGGQKFIENTVYKIDYFNSQKDKFNFLIEIDGGVNDLTLPFVKNADVIVAGSYIFSGDYALKVDSLL